jgi:hypothetical protein
LGYDINLMEIDVKSIFFTAHHSIKEFCELGEIGKLANPVKKTWITLHRPVFFWCSPYSRIYRHAKEENRVKSAE